MSSPNACPRLTVMTNARRRKVAAPSWIGWDGSRSRARPWKSARAGTPSERIDRRARRPAAATAKASPTWAETNRACATSGKKDERCCGAARRRPTAGPAARRPACSRTMRRRGTAWAAAVGRMSGAPWSTLADAWRPRRSGSAQSAGAAGPQPPDRYRAATDRRWASGAIGGGARRPSGPETVTSQDADPVSMLTPVPRERAQMGAARWHSSAI